MKVANLVFLLGEMGEEKDRTLWVGNLYSDKVTEELLYELFLQVNLRQMSRNEKGLHSTAENERRC